jgi:hypothetical protein
MPSAVAFAANAYASAPEMAQRRNFARPVEAQAATASFDSYLDKKQETSLDKTGETSAPKLVSWRGAPAGPQMSYEDNDFSFSDVVDFINPLQHIPVIGTLYREATGDAIKPETQVAGDILYGGAVAAVGGLIIGAIAGTTASTNNAAIGQEEGKPLDMQMADAVFGPSNETKLAQNDDATPSAFVTAMMNKQPSSIKPSEAEIKAKIEEGVKQAQALDQKKTNYGGFMDVPASQRAAVLAQTNGLQVGKNLYTKRPNANRVVSQAQTQASLSPTTAVATPLTNDDAAKKATTNETVGQNTANNNSNDKNQSDNTRLGRLMFDNAQKAQTADQVGMKNALPPELVQDMMIMALDKYQAASNLNLNGGTSVQ